MGICGSTHNLPNQNQLDISHYEELRTVGKGGFGKVTAVIRLSPDTGEPHPNGMLYALKRQSKAKLIKGGERHVEMLWTERKIMAKVNSPFLCHLLHAFQSPTEVFLVMPLMEGGSLRYQMNQYQTFDEEVTRFCAAEIFLGLMGLHEHRILYQDLKPDNVLLDVSGHIRLSDFGLSCILTKEGPGSYSRSRSGTRDYMAPEMQAGKRYGLEVDWWAFGVTLYELLHGKLPYHHREDGTVKYVESDKLEFDCNVSKTAQSLIQSLLTIDRQKRLHKPEDIKKHAFFNKVDWAEMADMKVESPIKPDGTHANFSAEAELNHQFLDTAPPRIPDEDQKQFQSFDYNTKIMGMRRSRSLLGSRSSRGRAHSPRLAPANTPDDIVSQV